MTMQQPFLKRFSQIDRSPLETSGLFFVVVKAIVIMHTLYSRIPL